MNQGATSCKCGRKYTGQTGRQLETLNHWT